MTLSYEINSDIEVDLRYINNKYIKLWSEYQKEHNLKLYPIQHPPKMKRGSLLFMGCNPSFRSPKNKRPKNLTGLPRNMAEKDFFKWDGKLSPKEFQKVEEHYLDSINREEILKKDFYFRILEKVCSESGMPRWEHIDLFGIRETDQKEVLHILQIQSNGKDENEIEEFEMSDFTTEQVKIALETIELLEPLTIVVISAIASKVLKGYAKKMELDLMFRENLGTYMMTVGKKQIPVFFSGMLARQRALDVFSRERLTWHIRFAHTFREKDA